MNFKASISFETQISFYGSVEALFKSVGSLSYGRKLWLIDSTVYSLYALCLHEQVFNEDDSNTFVVIPAGEDSKTLQEALRIYNVLAELEWTKSDALVALGGGMVGDLTGFIAGTYLRGLPLEFIPTTLLSQLDSSIGGKVAVNTPIAKNQIGLYYPAKTVHLATEFLETLSTDHYNSGLGELIKMLLLFDPTFEHYMKTVTREQLCNEIEGLIKKALHNKIEVCQRDFMDTSDRLFLNFGHTLGHAIEAELGYTRISHGTAVALGIIMMTGFFESHGKTKAGTLSLIKSLYKRLELKLPVLTPENRKGLISRLGYDKKRMGDNLTLVGIRQVGLPFLELFPMNQLTILQTYLEVSDDF
jgi:3-dehydroquinate synthase